MLAQMLNGILQDYFLRAYQPKSTTATTTPPPPQAEPQNPS
jgi:hypothetical protein